MLLRCREKRVDDRVTSREAQLFRDHGFSLAHRSIDFWNFGLSAIMDVFGLSATPLVLKVNGVRLMRVWVVKQPAVPWMIGREAV